MCGGGRDGCRIIRVHGIDATLDVVPQCTGNASTQCLQSSRLHAGGWWVWGEVWWSPGGHEDPNAGLEGWY